MIYFNGTIVQYNSNQLTFPGLNLKKNCWIILKRILIFNQDQIIIKKRFQVLKGNFMLRFCKQIILKLNSN